MNFRAATDELFSAVTDAELARLLKCSVATVRQARLRDDAKAHRNPPKDWEPAVMVLAKRQAVRLTRLVTKLDAVWEQRRFLKQQ